MNKRFQYGPWLAVAALVGSGALLWHYYPRDAGPAPTAPPLTAPVPAPVAEAPVIEHPIEQVPVLPMEAVEPLPSLDMSDASALAALQALLGGSDAGSFVVSEFLLPRLVATIDNLPRKTLTRQVYAGRPTAGSLELAEADGRLWLDAGNYARYDTAVRVFESVDSRQLVSAYVRYYPLMQQAYRELGVADRQFNDRLVEVLDHLIATPEATGPIELVRISGQPRLAFADPQREAASVGHKALWRVGPDHAGRVKAKLRELRILVAGQRPGA